MSAPAHTPGPWEWDAGIIPPDGPGRYADIYIDSGNTIIASFNDTIPEGRANAHLIAAAPDLLEALRELHKKTVIGTDAERHAALHKAWAAITKATVPDDGKVHLSTIERAEAGR